jgi:hypothetical protein
MKERQERNAGRAGWGFRRVPKKPLAGLLAC